MATYDPKDDDRLERVKIFVTTVIRQEIEGPESYDTQDIYNFLAEHQSFRDFVGKTDGEFTIIDIDVIDEEVD